MRTVCFHFEGKLILDHHLVNVAPAPRFTRLKRLDNRVMSCVEMFSGVLTYSLRSHNSQHVHRRGRGADAPKGPRSLNTLHIRSHWV